MQKELSMAFGVCESEMYGDIQFFVSNDGRVWMYWGDVAEAIGADDRIGDCDTMTDEAQKAEELLESRFYEVEELSWRCVDEWTAKAMKFYDWLGINFGRDSEDMKNGYEGAGIYFFITPNEEGYFTIKDVIAAKKLVRKEFYEQLNEEQKAKLNAYASLHGKQNEEEGEDL